MMPWPILGVVNSFFFRVNSVCIIDSFFRGKIFDGDFFEGEVVVVDNALAYSRHPQ